MRQLRTLMQTKNSLIIACVALFFMVCCSVNCNANNGNMPTFEYRGISYELFPVNPDNGRSIKVDALISLFIEDSIGMRKYCLEEWEKYDALVSISVDSSGKVVDVLGESSYLDDDFCDAMMKLHFNNVNAEFIYDVRVRFVCHKEKSYLEKWIKREIEKQNIMFDEQETVHKTGEVPAGQVTRTSHREMRFYRVESATSTPNINP